MQFDHEDKEKIQEFFGTLRDILQIADGLVDTLPIAAITEKVLAQILIGIDKATEKAQSETCRRWTRAEVLALLQAMQIKAYCERERK